MADTSLIKMYQVPEHFLWKVEPQQECSISELIAWVKQNQAEIQVKMNAVGGLLFKGFNIGTADEFEEIAKIVDPNVSNLNPFDAIAATWTTEYTYEVTIPSIKNSPRPLSFHNEDAFLPKVPSTIMFFALEPATQGGETLLVNSNKVYDNLPDRIKKKFSGKLIRSELVLPEKVFLINSRTPKNRQAIEAAAKLHGAEKMLRLPNNMLQFEFITPAVIEHNSAPVWFNVIHQTSLVNECVNIWWVYNRIRTGFLSKLKSYYLIASLVIKSLFRLPVKLFAKDKDMHVYSLANGEKISLKDYLQINLAYWKSAVAIPLCKGDFVLLDNRLIAHGRMPYKGKRILLSCVGSHIKTENYDVN